MTNTSIHGAHAEHYVHPVASATAIGERPTPAKGPLASAPIAKRAGEPAVLEVEEKELPFTD